MAEICTEREFYYNYIPQGVLRLFWHRIIWYKVKLKVGASNFF
jgi:hypothetical protein